MATVTAPALITAEEYLELADNSRLTELVRGRIVEMNMPYPRHGEICAQVVILLGNYLQANPIGRLISNDSGVITERGPDTVRGADVAFYSYEDVPKGPLPRRGYLDKVPRLVFEVRSPDDRWSRIITKVGEYLNAGVQIVCVLDPEDETAYVYHEDKPEKIFTAEDEITFPEVLGDFRVQVQRFFE